MSTLHQQRLAWYGDDEVPARLTNDTATSQEARDIATDVTAWLAGLPLDELLACCAYAASLDGDQAGVRKSVTGHLPQQDNLAIHNWNFFDLDVPQLAERLFRNEGMSDSDLSRALDALNGPGDRLGKVLLNAIVATVHEHRHPDGPGADDLRAEYADVLAFHASYLTCTPAQRRAVRQLLSDTSPTMGRHVIAAVKASTLS